MIFVIGARTLEDLGELYQQEKALLDNKSKTLVNLSTLDKNSQFGTVNLYDPTASGCSEIMAAIIKALELNLEPDMATNLLAGIEAATQNLSQAGSADTFEAVVELMRLGGQRNHLAPAAAPAFAGFNQAPTQPFFRPTTPIPAIPAAPTPIQSSQPDWLKPKVFTGGGSQV